MVESEGYLVELHKRPIPKHLALPLRKNRRKRKYNGWYSRWRQLYDMGYRMPSGAQPYSYLPGR